MEAGERLRITVSGRPVADLVPLSRRPRFLSWRELDLEGHLADPGLAAELVELVPDTTDDLDRR